MAELNIVFRLRFAVALSAAICLLLIVGASSAESTPARAEYIVQMDEGTSAAEGKRRVRALGGRVTSPTLQVINGFGASLERRAARRLARRHGVKAVSRNRAMAQSAADTSGGYTCPVTDATTTAAKPAPAGGLDYEPSITSAIPRLDQAFLKSIRAPICATGARSRSTGTRTTASTWGSLRARIWCRSRSPTTTATPPSST